MTTNQTIDGVPRRVCHACVTLPRKAYCPVCDDAPAAQAQGDPVAYRYKEGHASWENEKPWEPTTLAHGAVLLERKSLAANGTFKGDERDHYLALAVEPLYAEQPAPVAVITYQQVFKAYEYAESHPHKYLRGTTNWCAAVAHSLNIK